MGWKPADHWGKKVYFYRCEICCKRKKVTGYFPPEHENCKCMMTHAEGDADD
jgi:hypothetical protein